MSKWVLGMDIGGTNIRIGKIDEKFEITEFVKVKSKSLLTGEKSLQNLTELVDKYLKELKLTFTRVILYTLLWMEKTLTKQLLQ